MLLAGFLPFFILIRGSVLLHEQFGVQPWLALAGCGAVSAFFFAWLYSFLWLKWKGKKKLNDKAKRNRWIVAGAVMGLYLLYGLTFISSDNAKTQKIRDEYGALHPFLRMGLGTVALFDRELVVTDLKRTHGDYETMGLSKKKNSLHYPQGDGFVHAVDLRTNGREEWRNALLNAWFRIMGFKVHRHTGTADHLHVSLGIRENPAAW